MIAKCLKAGFKSFFSCLTIVRNRWRPLQYRLLGAQKSRMRVPSGNIRVRWMLGALGSLAMAGVAHADVNCNGEWYPYKAFGFHGVSLAPFPNSLCNPGTNASWGPTGPWNPGAPAGGVAGGDVIQVSAWASGTIGFIGFDPNDLVVTPVSPFASGSLDMSVNQLSSTNFEYTINVSLSDSGVAARVRWYEYDGSISDPFDGDNTALPDWSTLSTLLYEVSYAGPFSSSDVIPIQLSDSSHELIVATNFTAASLALPIPATVWLFGSGLLGLIGIARRRRT